MKNYFLKCIKSLLENNIKISHVTINEYSIINNGKCDILGKEYYVFDVYGVDYSQRFVKHDTIDYSYMLTIYYSPFSSDYFVRYEL